MEKLKKTCACQRSCISRTTALMERNLLIKSTKNKAYPVHASLILTNVSKQNIEEAVKKS